MRKTNLIGMILFLSGVLTACASTHTNIDNVDPTNFGQLQDLSYQFTPTQAATGLSQLRAKSLRDTAMGLGAQGGLASASQAINQRLEKDKWRLEAIYNFNGMLLSHGVLPPVLVEGNNSLNLSDPNTIRVADKTYRIVQQARFVTTPPNWRDYLWLPYNKPEMPNKVLLPKNAEEQKVWKKAVRIGWEKGIEQAYTIFQQNLARLKRDFQGMALYRKLLQQKMISQPYVSRTELGITGDGNDMRINDQVLRITELPKLQTNGKWKAVVVKNDDN